MSKLMFTIRSVIRKIFIVDIMKYYETLSLSNKLTLYWLDTDHVWCVGIGLFILVYLCI